MSVVVTAAASPFGTAGTTAISSGGTGATTKAGGFDALSPMSASGDLIYGGASGTGTRLAKGADGTVLTLASGAPSWAAAAAGSSVTGAYVVPSTTSMTTGVWSQITFASTVLDQNSYVSGNTFVANGTGWYAVNVYGYIVTTTATDWFNIAYSINSVSAQSLLVGEVGGSTVGGGGSGTNINVGVTRLFYLTNGDVFRIFGQCSQTFNYGGAGTFSFVKIG